MPDRPTLPALGRRGEGWFVGQLVVFAAVFVAGWIGPAWTGTARVVAAGVSLIAIPGGAALGLRGIVDLGPSLSVFPRPRPDGRLVQTGSFALVRHPIYGGLVLAAAGWGLLMASPLALACAFVLAVFFDLKSRREEAWLAERFDAYPQYRSRTRRLIPFIY